MFEVSAVKKTQEATETSLLKTGSVIFATVLLASLLTA